MISVDCNKNRNHSDDFRIVHHGNAGMTVIERVASRMCFWLNGSMAKILIHSLLAMTLLSSCSGVKKSPGPAKAVTDTRLAGRVHRVDHAARFVLIRRYGGWHVGDGQLVETRGEGRTANLLPKGERLGEHVAADIRSGEVKEGDAVYIRSILIADKPGISSENEIPSISDH